MSIELNVDSSLVNGLLNVVVFVSKGPAMLALYLAAGHTKCRHAHANGRPVALRQGPMGTIGGERPYVGGIQNFAVFIWALVALLCIAIPFGVSGTTRSGTSQETLNIVGSPQGRILTLGEAEEFANSIRACASVDESTGNLEYYAVGQSGGKKICLDPERLPLAKPFASSRRIETDLPVAGDGFADVSFSEPRSTPGEPGCQSAVWDILGAVTGEIVLTSCDNRYSSVTSAVQDGGRVLLFWYRFQDVISFDFEAYTQQNMRANLEISWLRGSGLAWIGAGLVAKAETTARMVDRSTYGVSPVSITRFDRDKTLELTNDGSSAKNVTIVKIWALLLLCLVMLFAFMSCCWYAVECFCLTKGNVPKNLPFKVKAILGITFAERLKRGCDDRVTCINIGRTKIDLAQDHYGVIIKDEESLLVKPTGSVLR